MSISIPGADYTPQLTGYTGQGAFRFWCQKVLPLVYDDSLSYYELLNKVVNYLNNVIADVASVENNIGQLNTSYINLQNFVNETNDNIESEINVFETFVTTTVRELQTFVNNYFDNLDVQQEINHKLDAMASDGSLTALLMPLIASEAPGVIEQWMAEHITPTTPVIDSSLSIAGAAADAKATGDVVSDLKSALNETNELIGEITTTEYSNNRLNPDDITSGCYLGSNGKLIPSDTWNTTGFCFVENLGTIIGSVENASGNRVALSLNFLCTYDNNKNFIEQKYTSGNSTATLDSNVSYVRFSLGDAINPMLSGGTTLPEYVPYSKEVYVITDSTLTEPGIPADALATGNKLDNLGSRINDMEEAFTPTLIEIETAYTPRKLLSSDGSVHDFASDGWLVSDYVDIGAYDEIKIIATSGWTNSYYAFYDANSTFVSGKQASGSIATVEDIIEIASNIQYVRIQKVLNENTGESSDGIFRPGLSPLTQPKKWEGKKWVCLGDSLTEVNSRTTKHYHDYISEATGITVVNMGDSGSGYMNEQNLGTAFYQRAANVPTDADVYTIFGSGNDLSHTLGDPTDTGTTTICGCINQTIDVLIGRIPTIQLGIVAPTPWEPYQPDLNNTNLMAKYVQALKDICYIRSIPFLDLYHESNLRPWTAEGRAACYSKDGGGGTHPDETGHKIIAPRFEGFLDTLLLD